MRRIGLLSIFLFLIILTFFGCDKLQNESPQITDENTTQNANDIKEQSLEDISFVNNYELLSAKLLSKSKMLLTYTDYQNNKYQFRQYDLSTKSFINQSLVFNIDNFDIRTLRFLEKNFYFFTQEECFVFDFACNLISKFNLPENISLKFGLPCYWLSNNMQNTVYVRNPNMEQEFLYISDVNGQNEKEIRKLGADLTITDIFFSKDDQHLGFEGVTIPKGKDTSVGCYGYIDLTNFHTTLYQDDRIYLQHHQDMMLICDKTGHINDVGKGIVKILNLSTKEKSEIKMINAKECETANFASDPTFIVSMCGNDTLQKIEFSIYKDEKRINSISYNCSSNQIYTDLISGYTQISMDLSTNQILVFYYNTEKMCNSIFSIPVN